MIKEFFLSGAALFFSVNLFAEQTRVLSCDMIGRPVILAEGREYIGSDAASVLYEKFASDSALSALTEQADEKTFDSAILLAALADNVLPARKANVIRQFLLEKYLGKFERGHEFSQKESVALSKKARGYPPLLRLYLFRFGSAAGLDLPVDFLDSRLAASLFAALVVRGNASLAINAGIAQIRATGTAEENFIANLLVLQSLEGASAERRTSVFQYFGIDSEKMKKQAESFPRDAWFVRYYRVLNYRQREQMREKEAVLAGGSEAHRSFVESEAEDICSLFDERCSLVYPDAISLSFNEAARTGAISLERLRFSQNAAYAALRDVAENVSVYWAALACFGQSLAVQRQDEDVTSFLAFLKGRIDREKSPLKKGMFSRVFSMTLYQLYPIGLPELKKRYPSAWADGEAMAADDYGFENEEFEKRFQDSLRKRAKELKAKRAAASASAHGNDDK